VHMAHVYEQAIARHNRHGEPRSGYRSRKRWRMAAALAELRTLEP
jgi:hypothetical protein